VVAGIGGQIDEWLDEDEHVLCEIFFVPLAGLNKIQSHRLFGYPKNIVPKI
jgi:hypothetical protein